MTAVTHAHARTEIPVRTGDEGAGHWSRGGRIYLWLTLLALAIAAASLTFPSSPSYDPWSWLIWGREILHQVTGIGPGSVGDFRIAGGSSWKPLPVIFTTAFALFGSAQPNLWLLIARGGAVLSVLVTVKLTVRIMWALVAHRRERDWFWGLGWIERLVAAAPVLLAGFIVAVGVAFMPGYPVNSALGYSEGLAFGVLLIAGERAWDGHHRQAFALGILPALDRPEVWLLWGPYGLWLLWRDRQAWRLVVGLAVLMILLWVIPQTLGGGTVRGLVTHPRHNHSIHSAVYSSFPFWHELSSVLWRLTLQRVEIAALIEIGLTLALVARARRAIGNWPDAFRSHGALVAGAFVGASGFLWWLLISLETQAGFAGNPRYATLGAMLIYVGGAVGYGWACLALAQLARRPLARLFGARRTWTLRLAVSTALIGLVFIFVPNWFRYNTSSFHSIRVALRYQSRLREGFAALIQREGGPKQVMTCGSVMTDNLELTMVAWYLNVPITWIQALPRSPMTGRGPNVVFQTTSVPGGPPGPSTSQMLAWEQGWEQTGSRYRVHTTDPVTMYMNCSAYNDVNAHAN